MLLHHIRLFYTVYVVLCFVEIPRIWMSGIWVSWALIGLTVDISCHSSQLGSLPDVDFQLELPANQSYFIVTMTQLLCLKLPIGTKWYTSFHDNGFQFLMLCCKKSHLQTVTLRSNLGIIWICVTYALHTKFLNTPRQILEQYTCVIYTP
jgi:hypothetical protein